MRKESIRILSIEILLFLISIITFIFSKRFVLINYTFILLIALFLGIYLLGINKRKEKNNKDALLVILIFSLLYYFITYFLGFFSGFLNTQYSNKIFSIIYNVFVGLCFIIICELIRDVIVKKSKYNKKYIFIFIIIMSLVELTTIYNLGRLKDNQDILNLVFSFLPILSKNILLSYLIYNFNVIVTVTYRIIMEIPIFIVPFVPNFGEYIDNIIGVVFPILLLFIIRNYIFKKRSKIINSRLDAKFKKIYIITSVFLLFIIITMVVLVSGILRYQAFTIGSGSMNPTISVGDVVIVDKKKKGFNKDDIIAYSHVGVVLVHRIHDIYKDNGKKVYITKGDNNKDIDSWLVMEDDIIGHSTIKFRFIGWPTVMLSKWLDE